MATEITEQVLRHHLEAFLDLDSNEIMKDYTADSRLYTPQGEVKGLEGIKGFFDYVFSLLPMETFEFTTLQQFVFGNHAYVAFNCRSSVVDVPMGTDTFNIQDGKIMWQALGAHIVPK